MLVGKEGRWLSPIRGSGAPHRPRKQFQKGEPCLENGGWARRGPRPNGAGRQQSALDASQVAESGSVRFSQVSFHEKLLIPEEAEGEKFFEKLWRLPQPHPARVRQLYPHLKWVRRDLWKSRSSSEANCYTVKDNDTLRVDLKQGGPVIGHLCFSSYYYASRG
jgi:hypothetical protein